MRLVKAGSLWVLAVCAAGTSGCAQPPAPDTSEADLNAIRAITDRFDEAINVGDFEALAGLYDENAIRMPSEAPAQIGKAAIREWFRVEAEQFEVEIDNVVRDTQISGDWAYSWGDASGTLTARDGTETRAIDSKWMSVSRRVEDGSWKVYRDIYNSNIPIQPPQG